jgi:hypothetical protein
MLCSREQPGPEAGRLRVDGACICPIRSSPHCVDTGLHSAFSKLTTPLWHGSDWYGDNHLLPNVQDSLRAEESSDCWKSVHRSAKLILHQM